MQKASAAFNQLSKMWSSKKLLFSIKLCIYHSNLLSMLLYGYENWHLKSEEEAWLLWHQMPLKDSGHQIKRLHSKRRSQKVSQPALLVDMIGKHGFSWLGHVARLTTFRLANPVLQWNLGVQRKQRMSVDELVTDGGHGPTDCQQVLQQCN